MTSTHNIVVERNNYLQKNLNEKPAKATVALLTSMQVFLGFDMGVFEDLHWKYTKILKLLSRYLSLAILLIVLSGLWVDYLIFWTWCTVVNHAAKYVTLLVSEYSVYNFVIDMQKLGANVPTLASNKIGLVLIIYTFSILIIKYIFVLIRCFENIDFYCRNFNLSHYVLHCLFFQDSDAVTSVLMLIVYYAYCLLYHMKENLFSKMSLLHFEERFVALVEYFQKIRWLYDRIIIIELCVNTPRLMVTLWYMLLYIKEKAEWYSYTSEWLFAFHLTIQMCIPAVVAEMINCQIDAIKFKLNEQRRIEKDKEKSEELTRVLRYIKARNLLEDIWRVVPIDLRLPLTLLSIYTTYFIVILQFTHLYD